MTARTVVRSMIRLGAPVAAAVVLASTACSPSTPAPSSPDTSSAVSTSSSSSSSPTTTPTPSDAPAAAPPKYSGTIGQPVHAVAKDGSTADITLNGFRYQDASCLGQLPCVAFDLTFVGTSAALFAFSESRVVWSYGENMPNPGEHVKATVFGGNPSANYLPFIPPDPLRRGTVTAGEVRRGLVISDFGGGHGASFVLAVDDESDPLGDPEAAWLLRTP